VQRTVSTSHPKIYETMLLLNLSGQTPPSTTVAKHYMSSEIILGTFQEMANI